MANPILNDNFASDIPIMESDVMSVNGTIQKSFFMLVMLVVSAAYTWTLALQGFVDKVNILGTIGAIAALVAVIIMNFVRGKASGVLATIYSIGEGLFLGMVSVMFQKVYPGIVLQAVIATFSVMFVMLALFKLEIIKCGERFKAFYMTALLSVLLIYAIQFVASWFGRSIPQIFTASPIGIGFSIIVIGIASFGFIMDFDFIKQGENRLAPKYYEWIGATGLMTSIVWVYVEILQLLAKLNDRS